MVPSTTKNQTRSFLEKSLPASAIDGFLKKILAPYLALLLFFIAIGAWHQIGFHEGFNIGDWLINYQGGFVRRGLLGEFLYGLSRLTGINPAISLIGIQTFIFAIYFYFARKILLGKPQLFPYVILIFSPFLFTFAINSQAGGYRKEIIYFAVLAFVVYARMAFQEPKFMRIFFMTLSLYPLVLLTDELGLVIIPVLTAIFLYNGSRSPKCLAILTLLLLENAAVFLFVITRHQASPQQVTAIINSLTQAGYDPKGSGAILALSVSTWANLKETRHSIIYGHYWHLYPIALLLCAIAFVPLRHQILRMFRVRILALGLLSSFVIFVPVFIIANDWGRWLYILLVELFMLILVVDAGKKNIDEGGYVIQKEFSLGVILLSGMMIIFYASFWYLPHVLEDGSSWRNLFHNLPFISHG